MRKSADAFAFQTMLLLCVIWGIQQVTIKWAATDIAPVMQAAIRSGIAAALVGLLMCWRGGWEGLRQGTLGAGLLTGTLFALEFLFIALGLQYTSIPRRSSLPSGCTSCFPANACGPCSGWAWRCASAA